MSGRVRGGRVVRIATLLLPAGQLRERYRQEFLAELHGFRAADQYEFDRRGDPSNVAGNVAANVIGGSGVGGGGI